MVTEDTTTAGAARAVAEHAPGPLDIPDALMVREHAPGAPVVITVTSVNSNGFSFFRTMEKLPLSRIYLRDPQDRWFQRGIGPQAPTPEAVAELLRRALHHLRPARVVAAGASMGGYGALLFGHLLQASAVIAMSPQTIIDPRLPHTPPEDFAGAAHFDLVPLLRQRGPRRPRTHVIFGSDDIVDVWNATRIAQRPGDGLLAIAGQDHLASNVVNGNGDLARAVAAAARGEEWEVTAPLDRRCDNTRIRAIVDRLVRALHLREQGLEPEEWADRLRRIEPEWAVPYDVLSALAIRRGDLATAERAAGRAAALAPRSITLMTNHAFLLMKLGRDAEAERAFLACLAIRSKHYAALCSLAAIRARMGDRDGALARLDDAIAIRPRLQRAHALRKEILAGRLHDGAGQEQPEDM